jgi:glycosyltransferase involved in cell wall biosynthesis
VRILALSEGDPDSVNSGSGTVRSVVAALRASNHTVPTGDAELYGLRRVVAAAVSFSRRRRRWGVKFRTGPIPFAMRSRRASLAVVGQPPRTVDAVLQYGSTFTPACAGLPPYFLYMDSCMRIAAESSHSAHSWAGALEPSEVAGVVAREQRAYEGAATVFTFSDAVRNVFINQVGLPPERVVTVYAGPNLDLSRIADRSRLAGPGDPPTILFIGREFERKGGDLLLRAFARIREKVADARLVIVGPAALTVRDPGVVNLGFLRKDDPQEWACLIQAYRSADVFCFPTRYEPFGIVILEAMLFGLPCVATRTGAIPEMIRDGETGYLVPVDDVEALTQRLLSLLDNQELARRFGEAGRERADQDFTWPAVTSKMVEVMRRHTHPDR